MSVADEWWGHFVARQKECGLPFTTDTVLKTIASGLGLVKAFTDMAKDLGPAAMKRMPLSHFLAAMRDRGAYNSAVKAFLEGLPKGVTAKPLPLGSQVGTASGAVTTAAGILASAYIGILIGCALYATDKVAGGFWSGTLDKASAGFWHWAYGGSATDAQTARMQAKLELMKTLRAEALRLGMLPSQLADRVMQQQQKVDDYLALQAAFSIRTP